jgi:murein tripeptide amidase MpaA
MAEYFAEGLLTRLLGLGDEAVFGSVDGAARRARELFTFHIVPNMCPDGSVRGHLRTNAAGANLNREWCPTREYDAPTLHRSPEVFHVLAEMDRTGVDFFADIHGDEALPFNFIAGNEGIPNWSDRLQALHGAFLASYSRANSDMQAVISYPPARPNSSSLAMCSKQIGARFDCLSFTLEMPFKDCLSNPDPERGWSPQRSHQLGASMLDPILYVQPSLRAAAVGSDSFPSEDAYIRPTTNYRGVVS